MICTVQARKSVGIAYCLAFDSSVADIIFSNTILRLLHEEDLSEA